MILQFSRDGKILEVNAGRIPDIEFPLTRLGKTSQVKLEVYNTTDYPVSLSSYSKDEDLKFVSVPDKLGPKGRGRIVIEFTPKIDRETPLSTNWGIDVVLHSKSSD